MPSSLCLSTEELHAVGGATGPSAGGGPSVPKWSHLVGHSGPHPAPGPAPETDARGAGHPAAEAPRGVRLQGCSPQVAPSGPAGRAR